MVCCRKRGNESPVVVWLNVSSVFNPSWSRNQRRRGESMQTPNRKDLRPPGPLAMNVWPQCGPHCSSPIAHIRPWMATICLKPQVHSAWLPSDPSHAWFITSGQHLVHTAPASDSMSDLGPLPDVRQQWCCHVQSHISVELKTCFFIKLLSIQVLNSCTAVMRRFQSANRHSTTQRKWFRGWLFAYFISFFKYSTF